MITLTSDSDVLNLPEDLFWSDEHTWQPVEQAVSRTITGALIVEAAARIGGRPVTLEPEDEKSAWIPLEDLNVLNLWAATPGKVMQLSIRGVVMDVMFRHHDTGISAKPIVHYNAPETSDFYLATVRLMEI